MDIRSSGSSINLARVLNGVKGSILAVLAVLVSVFVSFNMFELQDASEYMVIQNPITGNVAVYTDPGIHFQNFGSVTKFPRRNEYTFGAIKVDEKTNKSRCIGGQSIRFYDGGHADACGAVSWEMPSDEKSIIEIYKAFRTATVVESQAIGRALESAAYFSGPTMSSLESAAGRRTELLQYINDQMANGVYKTVAKTIDRVDETGMKHTNTVTEIVLNSTGQPVRAQSSFVKTFNIRLLPMTINTFTYDDRVEKQINDQQQATNAVQVAIANAKRAEQDAKTAAATGEAAAMTAKWKQETANAKVISETQAKVTIAEADVKAAELEKRAAILRAEGDARARQLVMEADGALQQKLAAYIEVNKAYADAIHKYQGSWVPSVMMGGGGPSTSVNGATSLMDMLAVKTARDLAVEVSPQGRASKK